MKTIVSVRLSEERLSKLDETAARLGMNRSQAIDAALRVFPEILSGKFEFQYKPKKLFASMKQGKTWRE